MGGVGVVQRISVVGALTRCDDSFLHVTLLAPSAFSAFFAIFEITRRVGQVAKSCSEDFIAYVDKSKPRNSLSQHFPRILNSAILVSGGVRPRSNPHYH